MNQLQNIPIENLHRRDDVRDYGDEEVATLAASIEKNGLFNPPTVRETAPGKFEIVAGSHRVAACDSLGWHEVPCLVHTLDDLHAELVMIDENLIRAELSPAQRAEQTARRKSIYETLHPETRHGANAGDAAQARWSNASRQVGDTHTADRFTTETAATTGRSERAVQRDAERGERIAPEAMREVVGTARDTGAYLDKLKRVPREEQVETVRRDLAAPLKPHQSPQRVLANKAAAPSARMDPARAYKRFLGAAFDIGELIAADIMAGLPAPKDRAALVSHVRGLLDILSELDALLQDGVR